MRYDFSGSPVHICEGLRKAFDDMISEARAELHEHEIHVAGCKLRLDALLKLRAALEPSPAEELQQ